MKNKKIDRKAWIRIIESFLAAMIIIGAVLIILSKSGGSSDISETVYEKQSHILEVIAENNTLREYVLTDNKPELEGAISKMIPNSWNFSINICEINNNCGNPSGIYDKQVYSSERLITSVLDSYDPKKLRIFVWMN